MSRDGWVFTTPGHVVRQLAVDVGAATGDELGAAVDGSPEPERRRLLDRADRAGHARRQHEAFQAVAASAGHVERGPDGAAFLTCSHEDCPEYPRDERGNPAMVNVKRWFCRTHEAEATPGDSEPWRLPIVLDEHGGLCDLEERQFERERAAHLERQSAARQLVRQAEAEAGASELDDGPAWGLPDWMR